MTFGSLIHGCLVLIPVSVALAATPVVVERVPDGGLQPRIRTDAAGTAHLVYLRGTPGAADVIYRHRQPGATNWSDAWTVNSVPGSALAIGTVRGAQIAVGRAGRVHFVWNGSEKATPRPSVGAPLVFATWAKDQVAASPQRNLSGDTRYLDGGCSVGADSKGRVYVVWHAASATGEGESIRRVYVLRSEDDGVTFAPPVAVSAASDGVCGCCGLQAGVTDDGTLLVLYRRAAGGGLERDMMLLSSGDHGVTWTRQKVGARSVKQCPMSTAEISAGPRGAWLGWETKGHIQVAPWSPFNGVGEIQDLGGSGRKHPTLAPGLDGNVVVAWTSGTGWQRGGTMEWQTLGGTGTPKVESAPGVPAWGTVAAYRSDNVTHVLY